MFGRYYVGILLLFGSSGAYAGFCSGEWNAWAIWGCPTTTTISNVSIDQTIPADPPPLPVAPVISPVMTPVMQANTIQVPALAPLTDLEVSTVSEYIPEITYVTTCTAATWGSFGSFPSCTSTPVTTMVLNPAWLPTPVLVDPPTPLVFSPATLDPLDPSVQGVPEPGTFVLVGSMTAALAVFRLRATREKGATGQ